MYVGNQIDTNKPTQVHNHICIHTLKCHKHSEQHINYTNQQILSFENPKKNEIKFKPFVFAYSSFKTFCGPTQSS